ncbi:MAG: DUF3006 family protein [Myxococcales bacterium]|jgi:hypothetical protein
MARPFVDRIEGRTAVLIVEGQEKRVPLRSLPKGIREGLYLSEDLSRIEPAETAEATAEVAARRRRLQRDDDGGDFSL